MTKKSILSLLLLVVVKLSLACTTAVISGKATPDGRPLLWKLRDTEAYENKLMYMEDGKYAAVGLVNSDDAEGTQIWSGSNEMGFAIMNSASFNLRNNDTITYRDKEGFLMKQALISCATVDEFEQFLKDYPKPMGVEANFGVIDATGAAAYFETDDNGYTKFDANDPVLAPNGYIIRSNYSYTGTPNVGYGFIRFSTTESLFYEAAGANQLDLDFLMNKVSRSQYNSLTKVDLFENLPADEFDATYVNNQDCITRYSTTNSMVIQGVKDGENADFTTIWTILGNPLSAVNIPVWVDKKVSLPEVMTAVEDFNSPMCDMSLILKDVFHPITRGSGTAYMDMSKVANLMGTGIYQKIKPLEDEIVARGKGLLDKWRRKGKRDQEDVKEFYKYLDETVQPVYRSLFPNALN